MGISAYLWPTVGAFCVLAATLRAPPAAAAEASAAGPEEVGRQVAALVRDLDSRQYEVRQEAARRLEDLVARPELGAILAAEFQRLSVQPDVSFEVRWHVTRWRARLPKVAAELPKAASADDLDRLLRQADDDSYAVRLGALERLQWLSGNSKLLGPILVRLNQRLADPALSAEAYQRLETVRQAIRGVWLVSDSADWNLPPVPQEQLLGWVDDLIHSGPKTAGRQPAESQPVGPQPASAEPERAGEGLRQRIARQEIMDLLARDEEVPRVKEVLQSRLAGPLDSEAAARIKDILDWTRPAMVAEYWQGRRHLSQQHLLVGVPSLAAGAVRPSHFDRIDDRVAHCVSGQSLSPGDYPVGVAFPHPLSPDAIFHLVNLPTPRRRMAYAYYVKTDSAARLAALSRRTLDRFLTEKHLLSDAEVNMLAQLDAGEVSRFAGRYFQTVEDGLVEEEPNAPGPVRNRSGVRSSRLGMIAAQLALDGTKEAVPGLLDAIQRKRFLPPTSMGPYQLPWLAALSIARRDPWQGVDAWLSQTAGNREALVLERNDGPEVGATAAGLLLKRHHSAGTVQDLEAAPESLVTALAIDGFRYRSPEGPQQVEAWWKRQPPADRAP